ncbi:MAG: hypothetical protein EXR79_00270 [Myxococcales bacterium]|nr:hypothetical protein [Myxococcales bacterium]
MVAVRLARWLLVFALSACGGQGCTGCSAPLAKKQVPTALVLPVALQVRLTQHGFDVIAKDVVGVLKAVLGAAGNGGVLVDANKLLGGQALSVQGGLGIFQGKATVRDLVLALDLAGLQVTLVDGSSPARLRVGIDHAKIAVVKGVVVGETSVLGLSSDVGCQLQNGVQPGTPAARLGTMSATIDVILGVGAQGELDIKVTVSKPVLHDFGFQLAKDCGLAECSDQALAEPPCLECDLCATGKLASDALQAIQMVLEPVLQQVLEVAGNLAVKQVLAQALNGKALDVEVPVDVGAVVAGAAPELAGLLGAGSPLWIRARPASQAFRVIQGGLESRFDAGSFAAASSCVSDAGADTTGIFGALPVAPPPVLPGQMASLDAAGKPLTRPVDIAALVGPALLEEAVWALARSGALCLEVDSAQLWQLSGGKLLLSAGLLDLALPGIQPLAGAQAPIRIEVAPSARPDDAPRVQLHPDAAGQILATLRFDRLTVQVAVLVRGRWLTALELRTSVEATLGIGVVGAQVAVTVRSVKPGPIEVVGGSPFANAHPELLVPAAATVGVGLLFAQPLKFDVDANGALGQVLALPIAVDLAGIEAAPGGWLVVGLALKAKGSAP